MLPFVEILPISDLSSEAINYETLNFIFDSITARILLFMIMVTKIVFFIRSGHKMSQLTNIQMLILLQTSSCEQNSLQQIEKFLDKDRSSFSQSCWNNTEHVSYLCQ